jgi:TRAP transporter 4TM/12TM fusion protein
MAEYLDMPYISIIKHAILPALLYFFGVFMMVDLEAARTGIRGLSKDELPPWKKQVLQYGHLLLPIVFLLYLMAIGRTIFFAVTASIFANIILSFLRKQTRLNVKKIFLALWMGAQGTIIVAVACAIAGLMIGSIYVTGIGDRFISALVSLSGGSMMIALIVTMIAAIILGMGMPTSASYVLMVALIIPALIKMGILPLAAHMFAFYFACLSLVTPPVATASYVAAGIADAPMTDTSWTSFRIAAAAYIVPFMFVYAPALLFVGDWYRIILATVTAMVGVFALAVSLQGFWMIPVNVWLRIMAFVAAIFMIFPGMKTDIPGLALLVLIYLLIRLNKRKMSVETGERATISGSDE